MLATERHELLERRLFGETHDAEVARMHLEDQPDAARTRPVALDGLCEVGHARSVRGAHLDEPGARALADRGQAERATDLHELAPRDDHRLAGGEGVERQQQRRRRVVDDEGGFRSRHLDEEILAALSAATTAARLEIHLQVRLPSRPGREARDGRGPERRATEVGVDQHARGVDDVHEPARVPGVEMLPGDAGEGVRRGHGSSVAWPRAPRAKRLPGSVYGLPRSARGRPATEALREGQARRAAQDGVHGGELTQEILETHRGVPRCSLGK